MGAVCCWMEVWPELTSHLRAVDYNVGAVLAAFLLGFVIQFTLSNLRNQLSSRGDYYSNPVIRDRKDGGNNLVTEQDYSHQEVSVHAEDFDISKLMENYKIRLLWQQMRGKIEDEERRRREKTKPFSVEESEAEGTWLGSQDWVATWIAASSY